MTLPQPIIDDVVAGRYVAPELGGPLPSTIRHLVMAPTLDGQEEALVRELGLGGRLAVVADPNTAEILGRRVAGALPGAELIVLDHPKADETTAALLTERARHADGLIAVGSGTLNDLCKHVTFATARACAVFGTAPSMDGYVTSTVSITRDGFKLSLPAHAPRGVFLDLGIMAAAPRRMILAGLGDTVCRTTAQVDWLLSHLLLGTRYAETPYDLMREDEPKLYAAVGGLVAGEPEAMLLLTRMLVLSGLGVLVTNTSHCGSMGEHQISHYVDTLAKPHPRTLHGQQVGVATWSVARLQAEILESATPPELQPIEIDDVTLAARFGPFASSCRRALADKPYGAAATDRLNRVLRERWPVIRARLADVMLPLAVLQDVVGRAGMPIRAEEIGIDPSFYREAVAHAHEIRDRYSFLDLAAQAGRLEAFAAGEG